MTIGLPPAGARPGPAATAHTAAYGGGRVAYHHPLWLVTVPTTHHDGRAGTQSFAVRALTAQDALAAAGRRAHADSARTRRRGARLDFPNASAVLHR
ncbi:hypothetical protein [Kitasatospora sp. DSM 101779]|jgi:hypothetical protein|uniref:hypothetical protein n=1 Tax=Kitasatospora sp. DSM 101779 TaxID=2853165 RepID=UPI0021D85B06|nr:hypothetical protein [Kitasatospora sp. DSM 101779]MCU7823946.1 hypothetical protein [Kitasatospora sp. DSM 101779]